ncbi:MAG TPA: hypothetical protein VF218_06180 [Acidothermaceae bacterium]|jgi:hypothetical protein
MQVIVIDPCGTGIVCLLTGPVTDGDGEPDAVDDGEPDAVDDAGAGEDGDAGGVLGGRSGAVDALMAADERLCLVEACVGWLEGVTTVAVVCGELGFGLAVACAEAADAADADCSLACAETFAWEITRGVEPATSWPTRLTAVSVTAVTSAQDIAQPSAIASGRPAQRRSARVNDRRETRWLAGLVMRGTRLVSTS